MPDKKRTPHEKRIINEAAIWAARLQSSDATDADREEFALWAALDPAHRTMFDELMDLWRDLKDVPISPDRLAELRKSRRRNSGNLVVVGFLASATLFAIYHLGVLDRLRADHYTAVGEIRTIMLSDGSQAFLNTDTAITLSFTDNERRVRVLRGEAFFDVKPNAKPFIVVDGKLSAQALGTRYGVRAEDEDGQPQVQVERGKVRVSGPDRELDLSAGEAVTLNSNGRMAMIRLDENELAWRSGKLVFSGRPLSSVLATLGRYRSGKILLMNGEIGRHEVSGVFNVADTDQALDALEKTVPLKLTRLPGGVVLVWGE